MGANQGQRLSPADTRRYLDDYTLYRFGQVLSPSDVAKQAGVATACIEDVLAQKPIGDSELGKIARAIDVSPQLLAAIAGYRVMAPDTRASLDGFFAAVRQRGQKETRAA